MGYARAGFEVHGVDCVLQSHYPFEFHQGDAFEWCRDHWSEYDCIHASPPCQAFTSLRHLNTGISYSDLLTPTRDLLLQFDIPWVIENVSGAPLGRGALMLCGTMFGLWDAKIGGYLRRHRWFESNRGLPLRPACRHNRRWGIIPVYGHSQCTKKGRPRFNSNAHREAMGINWMTRGELTQAIPPAYTEYIGRHLIGLLSPEEKGRSN